MAKKVNRFYTPALPQYTSQFVEEQTPWNALIALEDQKLARTDAALAGAAKAESQFTSLTPGYRTGELSPQVIRDYESQLANWQEKHKGSLYSVPAMRDLTKLQGSFQADPRVKTIQQDFAQNEYYDRLRANRDYRAETDPNIDPDTRQLRQFGAESQFTPYDQPVYIGDQAEELRERFASLEPDITSSEAWKTIVNPDDPSQTVDVIERKRVGNLGPESEKVVAAREAYVQELMRGDTEMGRFYQQRYGKEFTEEKARQIVRGLENQYYVKNKLIDSSFIPSGSRTKTDDDIKSAYEFDATTQEQIPADNSGPGEAPIRRSTEIGAGFREWRMGLFGGGNGENYYQAVKNDPAAMIAGRTVDTETGKSISKGSTYGITDKDIVTRAMYEQPYTTIQNFESFWEESLADPSNLSEADRNKIERKKKLYDSYIEKAKERYKIGEPSYTNDIELNKSMSAVAESAAAGFEDVYDGPPIDDLQNLTPEQAVKLRIATEKYDNEIMDRGHIPGFFAFNEDVAQSFTSVFAGLPVGPRGKVETEDGGLPEQLAGAVIINPDDPNDFVKVKDKKGFYNKGDALYVSGMYENTSSQYGPGVFSITTGGKNYLVRGPKEFVEPYEFTNAIHSHELEKNNDEGDFFAFRGKDNKGNYDIRYRWNKETKPADAADVWMNVALDRVEDPNDPKYVLRVFQKDPHAADDDSYLRAYDEETNPNGYYNYPIVDEAGNTYNKAYRPTDQAVERKAMGAWLGWMVESGQIKDEEQALEIYQRAFPVNEQ
jgi:hypothetical protein